MRVERAAAGAIAILLVLASCGGEPAITPTTTAEITTTTTIPIVLTGTVDLGLGGWDLNEDDTNPDGEIPCWGDDGYDDIRKGANIVALDGEGNTLGVGSLSGGVYHDPPGAEWFETTCRFTFEVDLIGDAPFYTVKIAGREAPTFTHSDLETQSWHVELTLD